MNRLTALVFPLIHKRVWSFYNTLIAFVSLLIITSTLVYIEFYLHTTYYFSAFYVTIVLLISAVIIIIAFKSGKKPTAMTTEIVRAERMLLYQTAFFTFWLIIGQLCDIVYTYLFTPTIDLSIMWVGYILKDFTSFANLFANAGSLLLLFYLSSVVRSGFYEVFKSWLELKDRESSISAVTTTRA
ncbi:hypothetical protein FO519_009662 [Halicephalobus sp. NKZ332]|nr:hypothetical protein FO519_009662 [Halicephalobus sp. NKZ332]